MAELSLSGKWKLRQAGKDAQIPATVPGCVHLDLLAANKIQDPFYRDREFEVQWIGKSDWVYARTFKVSSKMLKHDKVLLRCEGLDTLASISINGQEIGKADNMFRIWNFDAKPFLKEGENKIEVLFSSVIPYIAEKQLRHALPSWSGPLELEGRAWVRKEPCNFGWDWGPTLVTCGIWRPIKLIAFDAAQIKDIWVKQDHSVPGQVKLRVEVFIERLTQRKLRCKVGVFYNNTAISDTHPELNNEHCWTEIVVKNAKYWWPNGLGEQPLYDLKIELYDEESGEIIEKQSRRIGLRTLGLDRHYDQWGESFQFAVNGIPFFAKGGNWIPADVFAARVTKERYQNLLKSVADANMNMLRVWGGGIYEQSEFYELCDELGICVWQDFMFACSTYPSYDDVFMRNLKAEFEDNIRRLRHHPCIALWCGNNELEQGLVGESWTETTMSWQDYCKLFDRLLPDTVYSLDADRNYWPSSPHTPHGDRRNFNDAKSGDAHLWEVWHGKKPFEWYRTCEHRFNSEFGFQSFPEPKTVYDYTEEGDRNITSFVMEHHQRSNIGNAVIMEYMLDWFKLPTSFESILWLSQIQQAMAMKYAVEHWRRSMPRGMGTLYWQINDCWPVASWSSIDYHGRWKALHYMAKKFYAPLLLSGLEDPETGKVELHVTSDLNEEKRGLLSWQLSDTAGKKLKAAKLDIAIAPRRSTLVHTLDFSSYIQTQGPRTLMLWIELSIGRSLVSSNFISFARPKHIELWKPEIECVIAETKKGGFLVKLSAKKPALWVWLELEGKDAEFSDNFFHLWPGHKEEIHVQPALKMTKLQFQKALKIRSLIDTY